MKWLLPTLLLAAGCSTTKPPAGVEPVDIPKAAEPTVRKQFSLSIEDYWRIELPGRPFDASGLLFDKGELMAVSDEESTIYRVTLNAGHDARLTAVKKLLPERGNLDWEGLARDESGRIYACEESKRWIARWEPFEVLPIDWSSVREFFAEGSPNASFEGIAVSGNRLWVANERDRARIIEVDLRTFKVVAEFAVQPTRWGLVLHYSDLAFHGGHLFVLLRHHRVILEVNPDTRELLAEYDYSALEDLPEHRYEKEFPTGNMEGLAVDERYFWLVTDNNGLPRKQDGRDRRPTLFKCPRPARN